MALINSMTSGISALRSFSRGIEVIGHNVANVNTTAFKKSRTDYADSFGNILQDSSPSSIANGSNKPSMQIGLGVNVSAISTDYTPMSVNTTGVPTDMAVIGEGFFKVTNRLSGEEFATRMGNFRMDDNGYIVTQEGLRLQGMTGGSVNYRVTDDGSGNPVYTIDTTTAPGTLGDIRVQDPAPSLANGGLIRDAGIDPAITDDVINANAPRLASWGIAGDGTIQLTMTAGAPVQLANILLMSFRDPQGLVAEGNGLYTGFEAAGINGSTALTYANNTPGGPGLGLIKQGALELSNVDLTEEFANLITTQRSFQAGSRIITVSDDVLQEVVNLKR